MFNVQLQVFFWILRKLIISNFNDFEIFMSGVQHLHG
jgi:hypothetical protein